MYGMPDLLVTNCTLNISQTSSNISIVYTIVVVRVGLALGRMLGMSEGTEWNSAMLPPGWSGRRLPRSGEGLFRLGHFQDATTREMKSLIAEIMQCCKTGGEQLSTNKH
jgi:hypothetical protein